MDISTIREKYYNDLMNNFIPYWNDKIDNNHGGVFTCIDNEGKGIISTKKYIWSQGRFLWILCKLKELESFKSDKELDGNIHKTYEFLRENALLKNLHVVSALEEDGTKIESELDNSIFADCFYILGVNAYALLYNDEEALSHAMLIYEKVRQRIQAGDFKSEPYPIPSNYTSHSIPMILLNVSTELNENYKSLNGQESSLLEQDINNYLVQIFELLEEDLIVELKNPNEKDTLLSRHRNPGHAIECAWFIIHALNSDQLDEYIGQIDKIVEKSILLGWDNEYGGLLRFVDFEGGEPKGTLINERMEEQILGTWKTKLWWPHSESLYTTLLLYITSKDDKWQKYYKLIEEYTFDTFPNKEVGEWTQIRNRDGSPNDEVVALPVKDPFHIMRSYLLIVKLCDGWLNNETRNS